MYRSQYAESWPPAVQTSDIIPEVQESGTTDIAPNKGLSFRLNISWTLFGNAVYAGCQWAMLVVLTKMVSPALVGRFALGLAVTAPVIMFLNLQLRAVLATDARRDYRFSDYITTRLLTSGAAILVITGIALGSKRSIDTILVILTIGVAKVFESISDVFYGLFQQYERMDRVATSMVIKGLFSLFTLWAGVRLTHSVFWGSVGLAAAWGLILIIYDIPNGIRILGNRDQRAVGTALIRPTWEWRTLWELIRMSLPLGFVMMLVSLNANIPRYFIESSLGERALGIFASFAYIYTIGYMFVSSIENSVSPRLAVHYANHNRKKFQSLLIKLIITGVAFCVVLILTAALAGQMILTVLYRPEYAQENLAFVWLMAAAGLGVVAAFIRCAMVAARYFAIQMPLWILVTGMTTLSCYLLVPSHGLCGAAIALTIGAGVQLVGNAIIIGHALLAIEKKT